jgi:hypoxanthine phosphoribosyltransferase
MTLPFGEVVDRSAIQSRVADLGRSISDDYEGKVPILVGVLSGSLPFMADLARAMTIDLEVDFLSVSRFGQGGRVRIAMDTATSLENRHVLVVEDIVDTGLTLSFLRELLEARDVASIATVTLLDKAPRRIVEVPLEYRGFEVGDEFLLGYGLDWEGRYRNMPSLWAVFDLAAFQEEPDRLAASVYGHAGDSLTA